MTLFRKVLPVTLGVFALVAMSCDNNDEIKVDPAAEFDAVLIVNEAGPANPNVDVAVDAVSQSSIKAKVSFVSTSDMKRLYITQNIKGAGEQIYKPSESVDLKGDGAIDLTGKNSKNFDFQFTLPVPSGLGNGTVVYKFWVTSGNGDFRDQAKRLIGTPGTITLKSGTASNPVAFVKSYTSVQLFTPTQDAKSLTFISLLNGTVYKIDQGEEYLSFWDFGYINLQNGGPSLHATSSYPTVAIPSLANISDKKNSVYFRNSTKTVADFDAVKVSSDLNFVAAFSAGDNTFVSDLVANDVVEFVDSYGKKGLLKVIEATPGNEASKFIRISIKVQP
jgi:hypothetical protein